MDTIQKQKIGLCIGGTKIRQSGFTPLVISGILACDVKKMDRVSLVQENPAYIITHTNEYILYQLIDSYVKAYDSDTSGLLSIALTIKKDVQLADGKSPYSLLKEAYDKFRSEYMKLDNKGYENFLNKDVNSADFDAILERYPLEERLSEYILMSSDPNSRSGKLCVPQEKLEELFRDSQYPEFTQFKEIEIGVDSSKTLSARGLENIEIPRPQTYTIEVNGIRMEQKLTRRSDSFNTARFLHDTEDVKYEQMSFNLGELLDAPTHRSELGNSSVVLDKERNLIICTIEEKHFTYSLEYKVLGGTEEERKKMANWILHKEVKLTFGGKSPEFFPSSSNPKKTSIPASWAHQVVSYQAEQMVTFGFHVTSIVDDESKHVMVTITIDTPQKKTYSDDFSKSTNRKYSLNNPLVNTLQPYRGQRMEDDHEEDLVKLASSDKQPSNRGKNKWILFGVYCFVSMCIGAGIVGTAWWFGRKISYDESIQITKDKIRTVPFEKIISVNEADTLATLRSFRKAIEEKLRSQINAEIEQQKVTETEAKENEAEEDEKIQVQQKTTEETKKKLNKAREAILLEINKTHNITECRKHKNWNDLSRDDQLAVEAVLNLEQYKRTVKKSVEKLLKSKKTYHNWDDLIKTHGEILKIIDKNKEEK